VLAAQLGRAEPGVMACRTPPLGRLRRNRLPGSG
jgi:hypothetical protein